MRVRIANGDLDVDVEHDGPYSPDVASDLVNRAWELWCWVTTGSDDET